MVPCYTFIRVRTDCRSAIHSIQATNMVMSTAMDNAKDDSCSLVTFRLTFPTITHWGIKNQRKIGKSLSRPALSGYPPLRTGHLYYLQCYFVQLRLNRCSADHLTPLSFTRILISLDYSYGVVEDGYDERRQIVSSLMVNLPARVFHVVNPR